MTYDEIDLQFEAKFGNRTWSLETRKEMKRFAERMCERATREIKGCEQCALCVEHHQHDKPKQQH